MTKNQFLLKLVTSWWDCIRNDEIEDELLGVGAGWVSLEKKYYPDFSEDNTLPTIRQINKDMDDFFRKLEETFRNKEKKSNE